MRDPPASLHEGTIPCKPCGNRKPMKSQNIPRQDRSLPQKGRRLKILCPPRRLPVSDPHAFSHNSEKNTKAQKSSRPTPQGPRGSFRTHCRKTGGFRNRTLPGREASYHVRDGMPIWKGNEVFPLREKDFVRTWRNAFPHECVLSRKNKGGFGDAWKTGHYNAGILSKNGREDRQNPV